MIENWFDPQSHSIIQHNAQGLLHIEREFIAHYIKYDSGFQHLMASMQTRKYSEDYLKHSSSDLSDPLPKTYHLESMSP